MRSTIEAAAARTRTRNGQAMSPPAPHQLWPVEKSGMDMSRANAAGLKMWPRGVVSRYFEAVANTPTNAVTSSGVSGASTNATMVPESRALVGQLGRRPSITPATSSVAHAPIIAARTCGATSCQPVAVPATPSRTAKMGSSAPFGVLRSRRVRSMNMSEIPFRASRRRCRKRGLNCEAEGLGAVRGAAHVVDLRALARNDLPGQRGDARDGILGRDAGDADVRDLAACDGYRHRHVAAAARTRTRVGAVAVRRHDR